MRGGNPAIDVASKATRTRIVKLLTAVIATDGAISVWVEDVCSSGPSVVEAQLSTALCQARGVVQLAAKHSGEVVELDRNKMSWVLHSLAPGPASAEWSPQWRCAENGEPPECAKDLEYGYPPAQDSFRKMNSEVERVLRESSGLGINRNTLAPNWAAQCLRTVVPCVGANAYEWRRTGQVVTLGALFMALGNKWSALFIYYFYRTLRIVAIKRPKNSVSAGAAGSSAQALPGG